MILTLLWVKRVILVMMSHYSYLLGPPPGPPRPIYNDTRAGDLFLRFFSEEAMYCHFDSCGEYFVSFCIMNNNPFWFLHNSTGL